MVRNKPRFFVVLGATCVLSPPSVASAQMFANLAPNTAMTNLMFAPVVNQTRRQLAQGDQSGDEGLQSVDEQSAKALVFQPSKARRKQNLQSFVAKARSVDPQGAADMETLFASTDFIGAIDEKMMTVGLRANNVADAYALWWMLAWHAVNGTESDPNRETATAVRDQAERAILATPQFAGADAAAKQNFAEALLVQAALVDAMNDEYGSDPRMQARLAKSVNDGARAMGLDLTSMKLTRDGFVMQDGASAGDQPVGLGGESPSALAAAGAAAGGHGGKTVDGDTDLSSYALPALGGTAALAAVFLLGRAAGRRG